MILTRAEAMTLAYLIGALVYSYRCLSNERTQVELSTTLGALRRDYGLIMMSIGVLWCVLSIAIWPINWLIDIILRIRQERS